jgi:hypothetical protein
MLFHKEFSANSNIQIRIGPNTNTVAVVPASMSDSEEGVTIHVDTNTIIGGADENKSPSAKGVRRDENSG